MFICTYVHMHCFIYVYIYIHTYAYMYICTHLHMYTYTYVQPWPLVSAYIRPYIFFYTLIYVSAYTLFPLIDEYLFICTHIHISHKKKWLFIIATNLKCYSCTCIKRSSFACFSFSAFSSAPIAFSIDALTCASCVRISDSICSLPILRPPFLEWWNLVRA